MKKERIIRYSVLAFFVVLFTVFAWRHFLLGGGVAASVDALCPFGGFETLYTYIATGGFVPRVFISSLILAVGVLVTVIIFRKGFCGYICPFGALQELFGMVWKRKQELPRKVDSYVRYLKYAILAIILIGTAVTGVLVFRDYDPFLTFFHFGRGIFWGEEEGSLAAFIITIAVLAASIFVSRIWCRYLCPLAGTMNLFGWLGFTRIERDSRTCIDCKACDKVCPVRVKVSDVKHVKDVECINCNECVNVCPKDSLSLKFFGKTFSVLFYIIATIAVFFLVIGIAKAAGIWKSTGVEKTTGGFTGDSIKGWMTLQDVADEMGMSADQLKYDLGLKEGVDSKTPLKDIAAKYNVEFETENVRAYVDSLVK